MYAGHRIPEHTSMQDYIVRRIQGELYMYKAR